LADEVNEIRARIDIVDLVSRRVALKRVGKNWKGLCPFHQDRHPSFDVSPELGRYRCWSCGASGDVFDWVMKTENVDFAEALEILAREAGVALHKQNPAAKSERTARLSAMEAALAFFRAELGKSPDAREYCERRGLDGETVMSWELGYAPDIGEALTMHLKKGGFSLAESKTLFLVDQDASGGYFDKFRARLMFPIRDEKGDLVAFGGRTLGDARPKYINSGDTPIFHKSRVLYGLVKARESIAKTRTAVLVEGYLDVIACRRAGVTNAVASLGTALSEEHAKLLHRWCDDVTVLYDADEAGEKAAARATEILQAAGIGVKVALMPSGEDPDTLLRTLGPAAVQRAAQSGMSPMDYAIRSLKKRLSPDADEFWTEAVQILSTASSGLEIERHVEELAGMYPGVRDRVAAQRIIRNQVSAIRRERGRTGSRRSSARDAGADAPRHFAFSSRERAILIGLFREHLKAAAWQVLGDPDLMETKAGMEMARAVRSAFPEGPPKGRPAEWLGLVEPDEVRTTLANVEAEWTRGLADDRVEVTEPFFQDSVEGLRDSREKRRLQSLKDDLGDEAGLDDKLRALNDSERLRSRHRGR
jgi:DNA primase